MPFSESDFIGLRYKQLRGFCQLVVQAKQTPDLIRLVAGDSEYMRFCRKIVDAGAKNREWFTSFCRQNGYDPKDIRFKVGLVAGALGIYKQVDYYGILGVKPDADDAAIKQAYRKKAQMVHPDKINGGQADSDQFIALHTAYSCLSDPDLRKMYNAGFGTEGKGLWVEGEKATPPPVDRIAAGRFVSWMCVLIGGLVIAAYVFDFFQSRSYHFTSQQLSEERLETSRAVKITYRKKISASGESSETRGAIVEPAPVGLHPPAGEMEDEDVLVFFNPKRPNRYKAAGDAKHDSLDEASDGDPIDESAPVFLQRGGKDTQSANEVSSHPMVASPPAVNNVPSSSQTGKKGGRTPKDAAKSAPVKEDVPFKPGNKAVRKKTTPPNAQGVSTIAAAEVPVVVSRPVSEAGPAEKRPATEVQKPHVNLTDAAEMTMDEEVEGLFQKQRILSFLEDYTKAYEEKDLDQFKKFFADNALEQGKPFESLLPKYQETFDRVKVLKYKIELKSVSMDEKGDKLHVDGSFEARYQLLDDDWGASTGSIRMELMDVPNGFLVCRLDYEMGE